MKVLGGTLMSPHKASPITPADTASGELENSGSQLLQRPLPATALPTLPGQLLLIISCYSLHLTAWPRDFFFVGIFTMKLGQSYNSKKKSREQRGNTFRNTSYASEITQTACMGEVLPRLPKAVEHLASAHLGRGRHRPKGNPWAEKGAWVRFKFLYVIIH